MKKAIFIFLGLILFATHTQAQTQADVQKAMKEAQEKLQQLKSNPQYKAAMQKAQQVMQQLKSDTTVQKQMGEANAQLQAMKRDHPELGDVKIPDLNNMGAGMPNIDSLSASLSQQMNKAQKGIVAIKQFKEQFTPKSNPLHNTESLVTLKKAGVIAFTQATLKNVSPALDMVMKDKLNKVAKDSMLNVAGTGLFYLSLNFSPKEATAYLICKGILLHPGDPYAINALGVYYRDNNDLENALKLFLYADALLPDSIKSPYIYANIGWASFYYGDFAAGQKYFDKSLAISGEFMPALEGEAMIAYAKGDIKALYECLGKELMANIKSGHVGGAGGGGNNNNNGPSDFFTDIAATEYVQSVQDFDNQPDPTRDHSFDHFAVEEPDDGAADGVDVSYKVEAKPIFNVTPKTLNQAKIDAGKFMQKAFKIMQPMTKNLTQQLSGLTPLASSTTIDKIGNITISKSYRKYVEVIDEIQWLFERRVYWFRKKYNKEYKPFPLKENTAMQDKIKLYFKALEKCGKEHNCAPISDPNAEARCEAALERCEKEAACKWYPVLYGECNSDIETSARIWNKYWNNIFNTIQWYIDATNPLIRKVHDAGWNSYLNNERTTYIRQTVLGAYCSWAAEVLAIPGDPLANKPTPSCPVEVRGVNPPDPFSKKPKHIKEFEDPNCKDMDFPIGILGSITENCHFTKITIGPKIGPIQLGFTYTTNKDLFTGKVKDDIYSKNNDFDHGYGATVGVAYKFDDVVEVDASGGGTVNYNAKGQATGYTASGEAGASADFGFAKLGGKANTTWQIDADGNFTGHSNSLSGNASIGGNMPTEENASNQKSSGVGVGGDYTSTSNYDANGNYIGGNNTATVSVQQSGTTNGGGANKEVSGQTNVFGVQVNQVIQVVAGAKQTGPLTFQ